MNPPRAGSRAAKAGKGAAKDRPSRSPAPGAVPLNPLKLACARLGLGDRLELADALKAIRHAIDQGWLMEAEVLCRFVLANRPEQPDAWALRGETALADDDPASARVFFHEALKSLDELPSAQDVRRQRHAYWRAIAECNTRLNRRELAEAAHLQAARFDPDATVAAGKEDAAMLLSRAYQAVMQNRLDEAEPLLKSVLQADGGNAYAWQGLAVLEHKRGNHDAAIAAIDKAIEISPDESGFWNNRGVVLKPLGAPKTEERIAAYQRATALTPDFKEAYSNLADALTNARRYDEARAALDTALAIDPDYVGARINEVNLLKAQGAKREALARIEGILEKIRHPEALNLKGALLLETGDAHGAIRVLEESRQLDSRNASVLNNLGNAYLATARASKAIEAYRSAVILSPGMAEAQANLALALLTQIQHGAPRGEYLALAKDHLLKAQALDPGMPQLFVAEGVLKAQHQNDREGARNAYERALHLQPESVQALMGLAGIAADMGERKRARELLQRAARLAPDDADVMTGYIFALNYDPDSSPEEIHRAALAYSQHIQSTVGEPYRDWPNTRDPEKRLKVGFVSGDFRRHPVAYFLLGLFQNLPRGEVEVCAYHNYAVQDDMTTRIKATADRWRVIADQSTEAVCDLIRADGIDILIDLSGHTGYHRLDVFAKKPAPVSVSWLGFITTTGMDTIDYFAADPVMLTGRTAPGFVEQPLHFYHWAPLPEMPAFGDYGKVGDDFVFGSFNNLIKYSDAVFELWAEILHEAPKAKLLLKDKRLSDAHVERFVRSRFKVLGVAEERLELSANVSTREAHLDMYRRVDVALDPFPTGGAATSIEALAMGTPVISLIYQEDRAACYFTASTAALLQIAEQTIAWDRAQYKAQALAFYRGTARLERQSIALKTRELLAPQRYAPEFAQVLREAWRGACE